MRKLRNQEKTSDMEVMKDTQLLKHVTAEHKLRRTKQVSLETERGVTRSITITFIHVNHHTP